MLIYLKMYKYQTSLFRNLIVQIHEKIIDITFFQMKEREKKKDMKQQDIVEKN